MNIGKNEYPLDQFSDGSSHGQATDMQRTLHCWNIQQRSVLIHCKTCFLTLITT